MAITSRLSRRNGDSVEAGHASACFLNQKHARSGVPGIQIELPEAVIASAGNIGQVERCRTCSPQAVRAQCDLVIEVNIGILVPFVAGETGAEQGFCQACRFRHVDGRCRSASRPGRARRKTSHRVSGRRERPLSSCVILAHQRDGDAKHGKAVRKIRGAIERIDIPAILGFRIAAGAFLADDAVLRPARAAGARRSAFPRRDRPRSPDRHRPCTR